MTFRVCRTKRASMFQCRSAVDVMLQFSMNLKRKTKLRINTILDSTAWKYSNFGAPWGPPVGLLGASWGLFGASWGPPGVLLKISWGLLGASWGSVLGVSWGGSWLSWGRPLGPPGGLTIGPGTQRVSRLHPTSVKFLTVSRLTVWRHALTRNCARPGLPPGRARNHEKQQFP